MKKPDQNEYPEYYHKYIEAIPEIEIFFYLEKQMSETRTFFKNIPHGKSTFRYADGKWSIREILGHITETERIFAYRALRFAKNDKTPLPGFDENEFIRNSNYHAIELSILLDEFEFVRKANLIMFNNFPDDVWKLKGIASDNLIALSAIPYIIAGHLDHHKQIIKERYLIDHNFHM